MTPTVDIDYFYDEAFPHNPYLSGVMRAEIDRMRGEARERVSLPMTIPSDPEPEKMARLLVSEDTYDDLWHAIYELLCDDQIPDALTHQVTDKIMEMIGSRGPCPECGFLAYTEDGRAEFETYDDGRGR